MMKDKRPTTKPISARVNRAAWDWLEMNQVNKNKLLNELLEAIVKIMQRSDVALADYINNQTNIYDLFRYYSPNP